MVYTIFKGWHFTVPPFPFFVWNRKRIDWVVSFDESIFYDLKDEDQLDINKLCGESWGLFGIHKNSARFGMRCNLKDRTIELFSYCYDNAQRFTNFICAIKAGKETHLTLFKNKLSYIFSVQGEYEKEQPKTFQPPKLGFYCRPFFGGNKPAPHKIKINLKRV